jgi:Flp pilus assembly protein TadG
VRADDDADRDGTVTRRRDQERGQGLVEFSLTIIVFLVILMGVVDFGMAIYKFNGVSQAAREIARVTSVHPCVTPGALTCSPGGSSQTQTVINVQKNLVPGLTNPTFTCIDQAGATKPGVCDFSQDSIQVEITAPYRPITPLLGLTGTWTMKGSSSAQIQ